jgi:hypothetical protein
MDDAAQAHPSLSIAVAGLNHTTKHPRAFSGYHLARHAKEEYPRRLLSTATRSSGPRASA